jgi:O-antigen/teichoic acid export membrane protein
VAVIAALDMFVLQRLEVAFLSEWSTPADAGFYTLASQIAVAATILPIAGCSALLPTFAHLHATDPVRLSNLYSKVSTLAWILMFPIVGFSMIVGPVVVRLAYGPAYDATATILPLLLIARGLVLANTTHSALLYVIANRKELVLVGGVNAAASLILDVAFVWKWKLSGAAVAALLIQIVVILTTMTFTRSHRTFTLSAWNLIAGISALAVTYSLLRLNHEAFAFVFLCAIFGVTCIASPKIVRTLWEMLLQILQLFSGRRPIFGLDASPPPPFGERN